MTKHSFVRMAMLVMVHHMFRIMLNILKEKSMVFVKPAGVLARAAVFDNVDWVVVTMQVDKETVPMPRNRVQSMML